MKHYTVIIACLIIINISCKKETISVGCYDEQLHEKMKNNMCTMDCPGVIGCDGKNYCNDCIAAQHGIKVK